MRKFLIFNEGASAGVTGDAAHDVAAWPVESFIGFSNESTTATEVTMYFKSAEGYSDIDSSSFDDVVLTITENKHVEVMKDIVAAINGHNHKNDSGCIVVSDAATSTFVSQYITAAVVSVGAAD
jgi:hypothetical protein